MHTLSITDIHVAIEEKKIVNGVSLTIRPGEVHALMGPNGSGKSTLAAALMGHPFYTITHGSITIDGNDITDATPEERAQAGLFLAFQYPTAIPGVPLLALVRTAHRHLHPNESISLPKLKALAEKEGSTMRIPHSFLDRSVNDGLSGGEKKKSEILQLSLLRPAFAILDETDSGLDVDALRSVSEAVNQQLPRIGILLITHYQRILQYITPTYVHVMKKGTIVHSGGPELAEELEKTGYESFS